MDEFERVGRILAADQKLKVHVRGAAAFAVPGEVTIPSADVWHALGRSAVRMLHGLLDHETAHSKWTDFGLMKLVKSGDCVALKARGFDVDGVQLSTLAALFNMMEDARIEARQSAEYPGARDNLRQKNVWFWDVDSIGCPSVAKRIETEPLIRAYLLAACMITRGAKQASDFAGTRLEGAIDLTMEELKAAANAVDSDAAFALALIVYHKLAEGRNEDDSNDDSEDEAKGEGDKDDQKREGEGDSDVSEDGDDSSDDGDEDGDEGDNESRGSGDGEEEAPNPKAAGEDGDGDEDGAEGDGEGEGDEGEGEHERVEPMDMEMSSGPPLDPEDLANDVVKRALDPANQAYVVFDHSFDWEVNLEGGDTKKTGYIDRANDAVGPLAQAFEVALRAKREKRMTPGFDEGEADGTLLAAFSLGAVPVDEMWMQPVAEDDRDVVVSVLVDCSASMGVGYGTKSDHAQVAAAAISRALTAVQIPHEVTAFTTVPSVGYERHPWVVASGSGPRLRASFGEMDRALAQQEARGIHAQSFARECYGGNRNCLLIPAHAVLKGFNSTGLEGLQHINGIHENLDGEAVMWAAKRLSQRPEPRRVLMVLSDGQPIGASGVSDHGSGYLLQVVDEVTKAGIEVIGVGIASNAVARFYPHRIVVGDVGALGRSALSELVTLLLASRQEQDGVVL